MVQEMHSNNSSVEKRVNEIEKTLKTLNVSVPQITVGSIKFPTL